MRLENWLYGLPLRLRALFHLRQADHDLDDEMLYHVERLTEENLGRGMSTEDAHYAAMRAMDGLTQNKERAREVWKISGVLNFGRDLRYGLRALGKSPGFASVAILTLALGIGATTTIFSIIEGVLLRPLPFPDSSRIVALSETLESIHVTSNGEVGVAAPDVPVYAAHTHSFANLGAYIQATFELSGEGDPAILYAARLTAGAFPTLGVAPLLGRVFTQKEDEQKQQVAVLSYGTWRSRFHGNPEVMGSKIFLDRKPYIVIGVMPRDFEFPLLPGRLTRCELWVPMSFTQTELSSPGSWPGYQIVARLKPGISPQQAHVDAQGATQEIMRSYPALLSGFHISAVVRPLQEDVVEEVRPLLRVLFLAVSVVLLIICVNLAGLLLTRAIRRRREIALRLAIGARASALFRHAITEGLLLSITGGVMGTALAAAALRFGRSLLPESWPLISQIAIDRKVLLFAMLLAVFTGIICALAPTFAAMRTSVNEVLKEGGRTGSSGAGHARLSSALVIAEIAIALVLLSAAGLLLRSFENMRAVNLGFRPDHTLTAGYSLPPTEYATQASVDEFNDELLERLRRLPGVSAAAISGQLPQSGANNYAGFAVEGYVPSPNEDAGNGLPFQITGDYFRAMGIVPLHGRTFTDADNAHSPLVVVVNHKVSEHYWPGQDPVGKRIRWGRAESSTPWMTVVGEVEDVKQDSADKEATEQFYQPISQILASYGMLAPSTPPLLVGNGGFIVLRTVLPPEELQRTVVATVHSIDPRLALAQLQTMEQTVAAAEAPRRFNTGIITAFAGVAIVLAIFGIYSVVAFSVALRNQEMAIRMALGSQRTGILKLILAESGKLASAGCALGLAGAFVALRLLRGILFGVGPFDPFVLAVAASAVLMLAIAVSLIPARRAWSVDPLRALRSE